MRGGLSRALALLQIALVGSASIWVGTASADTAGPGYSLAVLGGRPNIVSGTPLTDNLFNDSGGTVVDPSGGFYLGDPGNGYVLRVSSSGTMSILAGNGDRSGKGTPAAGPATATSIDPGALALDGAGTLYVADKRGYVEAISPSGALSIIAGNGLSGAPVPGPATSSPVAPQGLALDGAGDLYVGTSTYLLKVTPAGVLSVVAGNGTAPSVANPPVPGAATASPISASGLAFDASGNLYVADAGGWLLRVTPGGALSIAAGNGTTSAPVPGPAGQSPIAPASVAFDGSGNLFAGDQHGYIEKIAPDGTLTIFAGNGDSYAATPGTATHSPVDPWGLAVDPAGNVYFGDGWSGGLVKVTPSGTLSVIAYGSWTQVAPTPGPASMSNMHPNDVVVDHAGNTYVSDARFDYIYKITPDGTLSILAGNGYNGSLVPGPATQSSVDPGAMALDAQGDLYFVTQDTATIAKISSNGILSVVAGQYGQGPPVPGPALGSPEAAGGLAFDKSGNLLVTNRFGYIEKITTSGQLSIIAGKGNGTPIPGPALSSPMDPFGLAVDSAGNMYTSDPQGYVEKITPSGTLSILAGNGHTTGARIPGPATSSPLEPYGVAVDPWGNVFTNDPAGCVEEVNPSGVMSIIAGSCGPSYPLPLPLTPGPATSQQILPDQSIAVDNTGAVYLPDQQFLLKIQAPTLTAVTPTVTGTARVGDTLTAHPGAWGPGTVGLGYQWFADGVPIVGATGSTYTATASALGREITVRVAGYETGYASSAEVSSPSTAVAAGLITERSRPYLSGTPRIGYTLTVHPGTWSPSGVTLRYRWLRDGRVFTRLTTGTHYRLTRTDLGHRISAQVIVTRWGYASRSAITTSTSRVV